VGKNYKNAAYTALQASGAALPEQRNLANLAGTIEGSSSIFSAYRRGWGAIVLALRLERKTASERCSGIVPIASQSEFTQLNRSTTGLVSFSGVMVQLGNIVGVILGENVTDLGDNFGVSSTAISFIDNQAVVKRIGAKFLPGNSYFSGELTFPNLESIGQYFLQNNYFGTPSISISSSVQDIGPNFMDSSGAFTGPLVVESVHPPTDNYSLTNSSDSNRKKITLSGSAAQIWKTALPDQTSFPYRYLTIAQN